MRELYRAGKVRAVGVSNFSVAQMEVFRGIAPLHTAQPPYNLFERDAEADILPYCAPTALRLWPTARCVAVCCPGGSHGTRASTGMIFASRIRSSGHRG